MEKSAVLAPMINLFIDKFEKNGLKFELIRVGGAKVQVWVLNARS